MSLKYEPSSEPQFAVYETVKNKLLKRRGASGRLRSPLLLKLTKFPLLL